MSQGTDASKDAESAAHPRESESAENSAEGTSSSEPSAEPEEVSATEEPKPGKPSQTRSQAPDDEPPIPETEQALNVPKNETVGMLAIISALTLILWFAARLACNAHPDQVREPKHFSTKDLTADPKNAAFEFHHSFETGDYTTALDMAAGELKKLTETKLVECESSPDACDENQKKLAGSVNSTGTVLEQTEDRATVELVSHYRRELKPKTFSFVVEKRGDFWRVTSRREVSNHAAAAPASTAVAVPAVSAEAVPSALPVMDAPVASEPAVQPE